MSVSTLVERLTTRRAKADQDRLTGYRQLVIALADDQDVDAERADAILLDSARTPEQLAGDVDELKQRRVDVQVVKPLAELERQQQALMRSIISARQAAFEAAERHRLETIEVNAKVAALEVQIAAAKSARDRLRKGRPDAREAGLRSEQSKLLSQRGELLQRVGNIETLGRNGTGFRDRLDRLRKNLKAGPQPPLCGLDGLPRVTQPVYDREQIRLAVDACELELRGAEGELKKVESRLEEIDAALKEIERVQLTP